MAIYINIYSSNLDAMNSGSIEVDEEDELKALLSYLRKLLRFKCFIVVLGTVFGN